MTQKPIRPPRTITPKRMVLKDKYEYEGLSRIEKRFWGSMMDSLPVKEIFDHELGHHYTAEARERHGLKKESEPKTTKAYIDEAVSELRHYLDRLDLDPQRLADIDQRIATIHDVARKHRTEPEELPALSTRLSAELAELENADYRLGQLEAEVKSAQQAYVSRATALSASRKKAANKLGEQALLIGEIVEGPAGVSYSV